MCPRRKQQVDWKIGVKHCPLGHANHLDEDYCVRCDFPFGSNPVRRRPRPKPKPKQFRSWAAIAVLLGLLVSSLIFVISGWKQPAPPEDPTAEQQLASRILKLERKVGWLEGELRSQAMILDELTARSAPVPTPAIAVDLNPVPVGSVLVVQVERGNVRSGPGTTYPVIGNVKSGQIIREVMGRHDNGWYLVCCVDGKKPGWLAGSLVVLQN